MGPSSNVFFSTSFYLNGNDNTLNGVPLSTILPLNGSDQDSDKSDNEHSENHMCCFCKTRSFKRTSLIMEKTTNVHLKPLILQKHYFNTDISF